MTYSAELADSNEVNGDIWLHDGGVCMHVANKENK